MLKTITPGARKGADFLVHVDPLQLKVQGVTLVGVYLKNTTKAQIDAYHKAGISVFMIHQRGYEGRGPDPAGAGARHGIEAAAQAKALGYPRGLPIVFASMGDYDNTPTTIKGSVAYYNAAAKACRAGGYLPGAYGDWDLFDAIGPTALSCQAAAKSWSYNWFKKAWKGPHPTAHLLQYPSKAVAAPKAPFAGVRVDPLDVLKQVTVWGPPLSAIVAKPVAVAKPILKRTISPRVNEQVKLLQRQLAYPWKWYTGPIDGKFGPMTETAVKRMQSVVKVPVNGVYNVRDATAFSKFLTTMRDLAVKK